MSRALAILVTLAALAIVLAGAWWIGRPARGGAIDPWEHVARDGQAVATGTGPELEDEARLALDAPDFELERTDRAAIPEFETVAALGPADARTDPSAGAIRPRGRVLDAQTGEVLPEYALELRDARGGLARVATDADGAFAAERALAPGALEFRAFERGPQFELGAELALDGAGNVLPLDLRVDSGPTYRIALAPADAAPAEAFRARFEQGSARSGARIGGGDEPWVRCAPTGLRVGQDAQIVLDSQDGVWQGRASVRLGRGLQPGVVTVALQAFAALDVRVVAPDGSLLPEALVTWTPLAGGRTREGTTRREGSAVFERVNPEAGVLKVRLVRWMDTEVPLVLAQGVRRVETLTLTRAPSPGSVRGTVVSDSGRYERNVGLRLVPLDAGRGLRPLRSELRWSTRSGVRVGSFAFDDLPVGRFRLEVSEDDFFAWEPRQVTVEAPRTDLVLVVKDAVAFADLVFEPRGDDGRPLAADFEVRLSGAGETRLLRGREGLLVVPEFPLDAGLRWRIDAPGRVTAFGAWPGLAPLPSVDGRERRGAAPVLAGGWSQSYRVVRSDNRRPIAGAKARLDGREAGATDAQGRIVLRADERPRRVSFHHEGWRQVDVARLAPEGGSHEYEATVRLEPPRPSRRR